MRRVLFGMVAVCLLVAAVGCRSMGDCGSCGNSGCDSGRCGVGLGGRGGCGVGGGKHAHSHGICDCQFDDYCSTRSPWVRFGGAQPATMPPASEPLPAPLPRELPPTPKGKKLE